MATTKASLSRRNREVAELIAQGLTSRDIAKLLFLSERTVEGHVSRIMDKLGVSTRSQIAAWVVENREPAVADEAAGRLPKRISSFVGRRAELRDLAEIMPGSRVITLVGPGGVGKTRLAQQFVNAIAARFPGGAWMVDLSPLADPELLPAIIRSQLGVQEKPGQSNEELIAMHWGKTQALLLLDNCEHLIEASARIVQFLVQRCPRLTVLATSREALHVEGEVVVRVAPLTPDDAIQLFEERAVAADSSFAATSESNSKSLIADICAGLDGLPLAIELAAAQVGALPLEDVKRLLINRVDMLRVPRAQPGRHQSLVVAIDWSYGLLAEPERAIFDRVSVFRGFDLAAARTVCSQGPENGHDCAPALVELVGKSLVQRDGGRYRMLETLRHFSAEKLVARGDAPRVHGRHINYFLSMVEMRGPGDLAGWLARMEVERDNLRAALAWGLANELDLAARLVLGLDPWWRMRARLAEARTYLKTLLEIRSEQDAIRVRLLVFDGWYASQLVVDQPDAARKPMDAGVALARDIGDATALCDGLIVLGRYELFIGSPERAQPLLEEALRIAEVTGDQTREAEALHLTGATEGAQFHFAEARVAFEKSLETRRALGRADEAAPTLQFLAGILGAQGELPRARSLVAEALTLGRHLGEQAWLHQALDVTAGLAILHGDPRRGLILYGASDAALERFGWGPVPMWDRLMEPYMEMGRQAIGSPDTAAAALEQGRGMSYLEAVDYGLAWLASVS